VLLVASLLAGCVSANPNEYATRLGRAPEQAQQIREAETRRLQGSEALLLSEATQVLQDLGYTVTESSGGAGVVGALKNRDATESGQVAGAISMAVLFTGVANMRFDTAQEIRVTVTTWPEGAALPAVQNVAMRVSFERLIVNNKGEVRYEALTSPELHREFFDKLGQSVAAQGQT
jgi:hypothetical protein